MENKKENLTERMRRAIELCSARETHVPNSPYCHLIYQNGTSNAGVCPHQGLSTQTINYHKNPSSCKPGYFCEKERIDDGGGTIF